MTKVTFIDYQGVARVVEAENGATLMETARRHDIPGIDAECGGACACATCHVYIDQTWVERLTPAQSVEEDMLDFATDIRPNSRLSCQIRMNDGLDGLVVQTPIRQS